MERNVLEISAVEDSAYISAADCVADALKRCPTTKWTAELHKDGSKSACVICIGQYEIGDMTRSLDCGHRFHAGCLEQWFFTSLTCPLCRHSMADSRKVFQVWRANFLHYPDFVNVFEGVASALEEDMIDFLLVNGFPENVSVQYMRINQILEQLEVDFYDFCDSLAPTSTMDESIQRVMFSQMQRETMTLLDEFLSAFPRDTATSPLRSAFSTLFRGWETEMEDWWARQAGARGETGRALGQSGVRVDDNTDSAVRVRQPGEREGGSVAGGALYADGSGGDHPGAAGEAGNGDDDQLRGILNAVAGGSGDDTAGGGSPSSRAGGHLDTGARSARGRSGRTSAGIRGRLGEGGGAGGHTPWAEGRSTRRRDRYNGGGVGRSARRAGSHIGSGRRRNRV